MGGYLFAKNLQGDVAAIYRSDYTEAKGYYPTLVASYEYDPWGKVTSVKGSSGAILSLEAYPNHIAHVNPIRYRGYYYDTETGFYYLQSRYYDPVISRFINADSYGSTGQGFLGTNMFAYCGNNPVNHIDPSGCISITVPASAPGWSAILEALAGVGAYANPALGLFGIAFFARRTVDISEVKIPKFLIQATEKISTGEPETPNISYPGNDPQQAPEGTSWRGNGTPGSGKGSYYNPETGESWHPDLNHEEPIGPHWDYDFRGSGTNGWRVFPDGSVVPKPEAYTRHKMATRKHVKNTHKYGITMQRM